MIKEFKSGRWYRWTGPKEDIGFMVNTMKFMLDGKPHRCLIGVGSRASFYDSPRPDIKWEWEDGLEYIEEIPAATRRKQMENGTVIFKDFGGNVIKAKVDDYTFTPGIEKGKIEFSSAEPYSGTTCYYPEPFKLTGEDGAVYDVYTRFHPQLKDIIGTEGYFYDAETDPENGYQDGLSCVAEDGHPCSKFGTKYAYFAVPIEQPKTAEITLQKVLDKAEITKEELMELITNSIKEDK